MDIESGLQMFEDLRVQMCDDNVQHTANIQVMKSLRNGLMEAGMSRGYADQLVATAGVNVTDGMLTDVQLTRLIKTTRGIAYQFYVIFTQAGFNDQAIALMGSQLSIEFNM